MALLSFFQTHFGIRVMLQPILHRETLKEGTEARM